MQQNAMAAIRWLWSEDKGAELMGKMIYSLLLCLSLWLGMAAGGEAAQLNGIWRYYELNQPLPSEQSVPEFVRENISDWAAYDWDRRPVFKQGTERLLLAIPVQDLEPQKRVLLFMTAKQAVRMWLGDEFFFSAGDFQPRRFDEGSQPYMLSLPDFQGEQLLVMELYANSPQDLGWFSMFSVDTEQMQMAQLFFSDVSLVLAFPVGVAIIFIMFLYYYFNHPGWKRLYGYIILFMLVFVLWLVCASNVKSLFWGWPVFWWYGLSILAYLLPISANLILANLLKDKPYAYMNYVLAVNIGLFAVAMSGELMGYHTMNRLMGAYYLFLPLGEGLAIYWCILAAQEGDVLCRAVMLPTAAFTLLGVFDGVAGHYHLLPWHMYLSPLGVYAFLFFVVIILREQVRHEEHLVKQTAGLEQEAAVMHRKSETDALTGCWNRNKLKELLASFVARARKNGQPFGLLMMDIDFFKKINDNYGHDTGDAVLRGFAMVVRQVLDKEADCIRWGGEEFMVLTSIQTLSELQALAEKIRLQVERTPMAGHKITCSLGITLWQTEADTTSKLFKRADDALYQAKNNGRNCIMAQL